MPTSFAAPPPGAHWDGEAVQVSVWAERAQAVQICLFTEALGAAETERRDLTRSEGGFWRGRFTDLRPGQLYGLRVTAPFDPAAGLLGDPSKLLVDPWAAALTSGFQWHEALFRREGAPSLDSAPFVPKGVVVEERFDWGEDAPPHIPWNDTLIYECHVRALTQQHPGVPEAQRGRYLGLCSPPILEHLRSLGVTALELLPVQHFVSEHGLARRGQSNAWGYNPLAFTAPHAGYASGDRGEQVREFKTMVKTLHAAGFEVLLDVVYNHTAEGDAFGPILSLKGLDTRAYYRLLDGDARRFVDVSGCGNTFNTATVPGLRLTLDSLRAWVRDFHVDGFRFDLAPALGRDAALRHAEAFWHALLQDPLLSRVKLIAEPWDLGHDGWRAGTYPAGMAEWNGVFRDTVRRFWTGAPGQISDLARRLAGSADLFPDSPLRSVNFVTCHDGFTLADLVSYERKHNLANGEENRDGTDSNWSRNWGAEGSTDDPAILATRARVQRSLLATTALSRGVMMLLAGDELGRTQGGNNNAYCQDNPSGWVDWQLTAPQREFLDFARRLLAARRACTSLRSAVPPGSEALRWLRPDGSEMSLDDWHAPSSTAVGMLVPEERALLLLVNGGEADVDFALPRPRQRLRAVSAPPAAGEWQVLVESGAARSAGSASCTLPAQGLILLRWQASSEHPVDWEPGSPIL
ncbi:MAG: glycogen debranching protein GlgX [Planctomycetota bacterium]